MSQNNNMEYLSLCHSCKNAVDCHFREHCQQPSFYCEEFEIGKGPFAETIEKAKSLPAYSLDADEEISKSLGLCSNCESRRSCTFLKPEGGVWHCEEYR